MIITHLSAENLLKYKKLELKNLPREGVITISGQNESGKSTIGETVCFALFGRTFSLADEEIPLTGLATGLPLLPETSSAPSAPPAGDS